MGSDDDFWPDAMVVGDDVPDGDEVPDDALCYCDDSGSGVSVLAEHCSVCSQD